MSVGVLIARSRCWWIFMILIVVNGGVDGPRCYGLRDIEIFSDTAYSRSVGKFAKRLRLQCLAVPAAILVGLFPPN